MTPNAQVMQDLQEKLGYRFRDTVLLEKALRHKSVCADTLSSFERLEFLGDRVVNLAISALLYQRFPEERESLLAVRLSKLIDRASLYQVANTLTLKKALVFERKGTQEQKILADSMEALCGALFLEAGFEVAQGVIRRLWMPLVEDDNHTAEQNSKSALQDWTQKTYGVLPVYTEVGRAGPQHKPLITMALTIPVGEKIAPLPVFQETGPSKRAAAQTLAKKMLAHVHGAKKL